MLIPAALLAVALLAGMRQVRVPEGAYKALGGVTWPLTVARMYAAEPAQTLAMPVRGVRVGQIKDTWGAPRAGDRLHEGQDIFAARGTVIYSAADGYVLRLGENSLGGNIVQVLGAGGRVYYYAHPDSHAPGLAVGDHVTAETIIGYVGTTGNARGTAPHLHFGVYTPAGAIDPLPLLADR